MALLNPGDMLLRGDVLYGSTDHFFNGPLTRCGVKTAMVNTSKLDELERAIKANPKAKMLFFETPTNPLLALTDIAEAMQDRARRQSGNRRRRRQHLRHALSAEPA